MVDQVVPEDIHALAEQRAQARVVRDWSTADELKSRIEAAGWRVVDDGTAFELSPMRPVDVEEDGVVLYGAVDSVPSLLDQPASAPASVIIDARTGSADPAPALAALAAHGPPGLQIIVVADRSSELPAGSHEVLRTVEPFSPGDAVQAGLRRTTGEVIVVLEPGRIPSGDIVSPLSAALEADDIAVVGIEGLQSADLRRFQPLASGDATAVRAGCYAFRRSDTIERGPMDARLNLPGSVATWWSLTLRDEGPEQPPRRALAIELPLEALDDAPPTKDHARLAKRDAYRISSLVGGRDWLADS